MTTYVNHSGGCDGADMEWESQGLQYGVRTIAYSFRGHHHSSYNPYEMSAEELLEGWESCKQADKTLKRNLHAIESNPYVRNLICRNWFQVKNSEQIFAVGFLKSKSEVDGGTGWAVQMALDNNKVVYFFDQFVNKWHIYIPHYKAFIPIFVLPKLPLNFAGIGTRRLSDSGVKAITSMYKNTFENG